MKKIDALYLGNLVISGLKPLARIEYPITKKLLSYFIGNELIIDRIKQFAANGKKVEIILISKNQEKIDEAKAIFGGKPLRHDAETFRNWGSLLGYPRCCVEFFADENTRHSPNNIFPEDQSIIYHWACPGCIKTKKLIPDYRKIWEKTQSQIGQF